MGLNNTWTEAHITTENRDRPGGHGYTFAKDGMGYNEPHSPKIARFLKRKQRRSQRREHARITREAIQNFYEDQNLGLIEEMEEYFDDNWYDDIPMDYDDYHNPFENLSYNDGFDDDFFFDPYDDAYDRFYAYTRQEDPHDRIIKHEDIGKSLGDLLQEIIDRRETA